MKRMFLIIFLLLQLVLNGKKKEKQETAHSNPVKPIILLTSAYDIGICDVDYYRHGMMAPTQNIDRIAKEGIMFTDHYAAPACTPGRAMIITGQLPIRTRHTTAVIAYSPIGQSEKIQRWQKS